MLGSPLTGNVNTCQPISSLYMLTPIKEIPGTTLLQNLPSPNIVVIQQSPPPQQQQQQQQQQQPKLPAIRPALIISPLTPVIIKQPLVKTLKRKKPATVRDMLRTHKKNQMMEKQQRQQRQVPAYQVIQHQISQNTQQSRHNSMKQNASRKMKKTGKKKGRPMIPGNSSSMDKKEMHRVNERHRHRNMNQAIRQLVSVLPKNSAPETETKQFVLQKANDYLIFLRRKIDQTCDHMAVTQENQQGGLMSFDIPFENTSGMNNVFVPAKKPITHTDLRHLIGPTSALKLTEPPAKRKSPPLKPAITKPKHQPWFEINIKMSVSPYKKSPKLSQATSGRSKSSKRKKTPKRKNYIKKMSHLRSEHQTMTPDNKEENRGLSFQSPSSVCSWASFVADHAQQVDQSSAQSSEMNQAIKSEPDNEVDLACIDVLSADEEEVVKMESASNTASAGEIYPSRMRDDTIKFHQPSSSPDLLPVNLTTSSGSTSYDDDFQFHQFIDSSSANLVIDEQTSEDTSSGGFPWMCGLVADGQSQMDHSYSARALSPLARQALQSLTSSIPTQTTNSPGQSGSTGFKTSSDSMSTGSPSAAHHQQQQSDAADAILKKAILMQPPADCMPPGNADSNVDVIQVFGLDFDEDSESSGGFLSQHSPEFESGVVPMMEDDVDSIPSSLSQKQNSMCRSWINGYQLFTKINHARIKESWPGLQEREITRLLGQSWKDVPDDYKKLYSIRACDWNQWYRKKRESK